MVAKTVTLPNTRKMFLPDPGKMLIDVDLERADAQVVAWEAGDEALKDVFRSGVDVHRENAAAVFQVPAAEITDHQRQQTKQSVHGYDYGGSAKTIAAETGMTLTESTFFGNRWFEEHPLIKDWQDDTFTQLKKTKTLRNAFGYEITFMDRIDIKRRNEGLAWLCQSVVAIVTDIGLCNIDENLPEVEPLIQVHDSLLLQTDISNCPGIYPEIIKQMSIEVPYADPLTIPLSLAVSEKSWGDVEEVQLHND